MHDLSDGGLAVGLAEMAMASGIGATISQLDGHSAVAQFFGEDQGRYLVTVDLDPASSLAATLREEFRATGINAHVLGTTGGDSLILGDARPIAVADLKAAHEGWFPAYMQGEIA